MNKDAVPLLTEPRKASYVRKILADIQPHYISFAGGLPDPVLLGKIVTPSVKDIIARVPSEELTKWLNYGGSQGEKALLEKIAEIESQKSGMDIEAKNIAITAGSQQGLYLTFEALGENGLIVGMPTYLGIMTPLDKFAKRVFPVKVDQNGIVVDNIERVLIENSGIKGIYTIPHGHNPAGVRLSEKRRMQLMDLAIKKGAVIIEDDPYAGTAKDPLKPIYSHDPDGLGNVIYLSTISKQLFAGRLGWMMAHEDHINHLVPEVSGSILHVPKLIQEITLGMILDLEEQYGSYSEYLKQEVATHYELKREQFGEALEEHLGHIEGVLWNEPKEGLFYWVEFPEEVDTERLYEIAKNQFGVVFVPGIAFDPLASTSEPGYISLIGNCARLNFSMPTQEQMNEGLEKLAKSYKILQAEKETILV